MLDNQVIRVLAKAYRGIGTARAKRCEALLLAGEYRLLQQERVSPRNYRFFRTYHKDTIAVELARKLRLEGDNQRKYEVAVDTFFACEAENYRTNGRLRRFINGGPFTGPDDLKILELILEWKRIVKRVLGGIPRQLTPMFTSGATLSDKGIRTTIPDKLSSQRTLYRHSYDVYLHSVQYTYLDRPVLPTFVDSNVFFTVPNDSEKDRGCCMEASGSIILQRPVGLSILRRYEKAYKVDQSTAQQLHQKLAREGSLTGKWATIDLSNASDTMARGLVKLILPSEWYALLNSLRATHTRVGDRSIRLEKFSSMGNGFTFELETLLFRTLMEALGVSEGYAFGDDMIVPTEHAQDLIQALRFFGFTPNANKTFCEGPFRESCGGDFFLGHPVRGHYLEESPSEPQHWLSLANGLRRVDPELEWLGAAWRYCIDQVPAQWRNFGPSWLGDTVFHDPDARPVDHTFRGEVDPTKAFRVMRPVPKVRGLWTYSPEVALASTPLTGRSKVSPRKSITGFKADFVAAYGTRDPTSWWVLYDKDGTVEPS